MGLVLRLAQDPSSEHLGTTVWDASIVMAKYFERSIRKGELSSAKVRGKRAIELGAGMGLGGLAFAMLGANVELTDVAQVLPLLQSNYQRNLSPAALRAAGLESTVGSNVGKVLVRELDWAKPETWWAPAGRKQPQAAVGGEAGGHMPYEYVLAADCIYHETLLRRLFRVVMDVTGDRSTVVIANERRSESVQSAFLSLFSSAFTMKKVPLSKMDPVHQHPAIELWVCRRKKGASLAFLEALEAAEAASDLAAALALAQLAGMPGPGDEGVRGAAAGGDGDVGSVREAAVAARAAPAVDGDVEVVASSSSGGSCQQQQGQQQQQHDQQQSEEQPQEQQHAPEQQNGQQQQQWRQQQQEPAAASRAGGECSVPMADTAACAAGESGISGGGCRANGAQDVPLPLPVPAVLEGVGGAGPPPSWEDRRQGAMAARLLVGVRPPSSSYLS